MKEQIVHDIKKFLKDEIINSDKINLDNDEQIINKGLIDSIGIVRLVNYLQKLYCIKEIEHKDMVLDNFQTIDKISNMIFQYTK